LKILVYCVVAVVLGLTLTLVPLFTLAQIRPEGDYSAMQPSLSERMEALEGTYGLDEPKYTFADIDVFAISFVIALVVYVLFKRKQPDRDYRRFGTHPFYF
jgi:hypothetical protein